MTSASIERPVWNVQVRAPKYYLDILSLKEEISERSFPLNVDTVIEAGEQSKNKFYTLCRPFYEELKKANIELGQSSKFPDNFAVFSFKDSSRSRETIVIAELLNTRTGQLSGIENIYRFKEAIRQHKGPLSVEQFNELHQSDQQLLHGRVLTIHQYDKGDTSIQLNYYREGEPVGNRLSFNSTWPYRELEEVMPDKSETLGVRGGKNPKKVHMTQERAEALNNSIAGLSRIFAQRAPGLRDLKIVTSNK